MLAVGDGVASACVHMRVARAHICRCARARACWQAGPRVTTRAGPSSGLASETTPMTYAVKRKTGRSHLTVRVHTAVTVCAMLPAVGRTVFFMSSQSTVSANVQAVGPTVR